MIFNQKAWAELRRVWFKKATPGRLFVSLWVAVLFMSARLVTAFGRTLDNVFFPKYREQKIEKPIFVFANPRSGTTLMHRLLSMDTERFAGVPLYQTVFSAVMAHKFFAWLIGLADTKLGLLLRPIYNFVNAPLQRRWKGVHEMSLAKPEEDEAVFLLCLQSPTAGLLFPFMDDLQNQTWLDRQTSEERAPFMKYYADTIRRILYSAGGNKRFLNKNVFFSTRIKAMRETFPDTIFVYMIRNPYDSLPSMLNMFYRSWIAHSPKIAPTSDEAQQLVQLGYEYYRYALNARRSLPEDQFITVRYEDLVACPKKTIEQLYARLDMEISPEFNAKLEEALASHREYESTHVYSLEQFGLTKEGVYQELQEVFDEFGYGQRDSFLAAAE